MPEALFISIKSGINISTARGTFFFERPRLYYKNADRKSNIGNANVLEKTEPAKRRGYAVNLHPPEKSR